MFKKTLTMAVAATLIGCSGADLPHKGVTPLEDTVVTVSAFALEVTAGRESGCLLLTTAQGEGVKAMEVDQTIWVQENGRSKRESWDTQSTGGMYRDLSQPLADNNIVAAGSEKMRGSCSEAFSFGYDVYWGSDKEVLPTRESDCWIEMENGDKLTMKECATSVKFEDVQNFSEMEDKHPSLFEAINKFIESEVRDGSVNTSPLTAD